jgi:hypothetical protein
MKRVSVTLNDDLEVALQGYISAQDAKPSLTAVVQAAIREFLIDRGCLRGSRSRHNKMREGDKYKK